MKQFKLRDGANKTCFKDLNFKGTLQFRKSN